MPSWIRKFQLVERHLYDLKFWMSYMIRVIAIVGLSIHFPAPNYTRYDFLGIFAARNCFYVVVYMGSSSKLESMKFASFCSTLRKD